MGSHARLLPGLVPRQQVFVENKHGCEESIQSASGSTFVFVKDCKELRLGVTGKTGKIVLENVSDSVLDLHDRVLGGTAELIRCKGMQVRLHRDSVVPIITLDSSDHIDVHLCSKSQLQGIYFQFADCVCLRVHALGIEEQWTDSYDVSIPSDTPAAGAEVPQWVAHWESTAAASSLVTEQVQRDDFFPMIAQMKKVADCMAAAPLDR